MLRPLAPLVAAAVLLAGCITPAAQEELSPASLPDLPLPLIKDGRVHLDVVVPVVLVGFPAEAQAELRTMLEKGEEVRHQALNLNQPLPPDASRPPEDNVPLSGTLVDMPVVPTARYAVTPVPASVEKGLAEQVASWKVSDRGDLPVFDARALETFLVDALAAEGHVLDRNAPTVVLLHTEALGLELHTWRYEYPQGYLEPVRVFGERVPMLVMDFSATLDPQPGLVGRATGNAPPPYSDRLSTQKEDLEKIAKHVREATHYRLLQGSIYPTPLVDCHAVTLVFAYRPTALAEHGDLLRSALELVDGEQLSRAYTNLTNATVHVDVKVLELPKDDPALDALSRGEFLTMEAQRAWLSMNWDKYWVPHEGCEAYVSLVVSGDAASTPTGVLGIGTYDSTRGYRISLSWVNEALRLVLGDPDSPLFDDESRVYNWINYLFAHETGHIIGQRHPHDTTREEGGFSSNAYEDVWSVMSYSSDGRVIDFGVMDQANYQRNRAGFLLAAAIHAGLEGSPQVQEALSHLAASDWHAATRVLWPLVQSAGAGHAGSEKGGLLGPYLPALGTIAWEVEHAEGDAEEHAEILVTPARAEAAG